MTIVYASRARRDLDEIWDWNAERRGPDHASSYVESLERQINRLAAEPSLGKVVRDDADLRYLVMQKRPKADGHIAGYRIDVEARTVRVLRVYHTKQDWQTYLEREEA